MYSITRATIKNASAIAEIGAIVVAEAHRASCSVKDMNDFLLRNYNTAIIREELEDEKNIYHVLTCEQLPIGFSKIVLNTGHPNIPQDNTTKLDRIYLLKEYCGMKLGFQLLKFNIDLAIKNNQSGIWLFTWVGNIKAVDFYCKAGFKIIGSHQFQVSESHYNEHHQMFLDLGN
jgi:diamine N-acetyltransferase